MKNLLKLFYPDNSRHAFYMSFFLCLAAGFAIIYPVASITGLSRTFGGVNNDGYLELAASIASGKGYVFEEGGMPVFHRPPFYPLLISPLILLPGVLQRPALILLQSLMVGFTGMIVFKVCKRFFSLEIARAALGFLLINPWLYWNAKNPMTSITQMFLYALLIYLAVDVINKGWKKGTVLNSCWKFGLTIGFVSAALALTHAAMLPVAGLCLLIIFVTGLFKKNFGLVKISVVSLTILLACILPWTYRNYKQFDSVMAISGGAGLAYFNGNVHWNFIEDVPQQKGESYIDASLRVVGIEGTEKTCTHYKGFVNLEFEKKANLAMINDIKDRPVVFTKKVLLNAVEYYFPSFVYKYRAMPSTTKEEIAQTVFHSGLWIFAAIGLVNSFKKDKSKKQFFLLLAILCYAMWYFPFATGFIGHNMYTLGTMPMLSILAAVGVDSLWKKTVA